MIIGFTGRFRAMARDQSAKGAKRCSYPHRVDGRPESLCHIICQKLGQNLPRADPSDLVSDGICWISGQADRATKTIASLVRGPGRFVTCDMQIRRPGCKHPGVQGHARLACCSKSGPPPIGIGVTAKPWRPTPWVLFWIKPAGSALCG